MCFQIDDDMPECKQEDTLEREEYPFGCQDASDKLVIKSSEETPKDSVDNIPKSTSFTTTNFTPTQHGVNTKYDDDLDSYAAANRLMRNFVHPEAWNKICFDLPMFQENMMYPDYDPSLEMYTKEAIILQAYMCSTYHLQPYGLDHKTGLLKIPT